MTAKVWINLDPQKVDLTVLERELNKRDCGLFAEAVPGNDPDQILAHALEADIVISILERWDAKLLEKAAGKVRFIQKYGAGLDNIDLSAAGRLGIPVANVPGGNSAAVAEVALLHILNCGRRFSSCVSGVKEKRWPATITGTELDQKTVGIMGYGNIARHLVRMLEGFQVRILVYDPFVAEAAQGQKITFVQSPEELFEKSDILSLHIPCTGETAGSINKNLFDRMKDGAIFVNTCRGGVVNEQDLLEALRSGKIAAAGLDVLAEEPPRADHPFLHMEQVFLTSHMGAASFESEERSQLIMAEAIGEFLQGRLPAGVRNRSYFTDPGKAPVSCRTEQ